MSHLAETPKRKKQLKIGREAGSMVTGTESLQCDINSVKFSILQAQTLAWTYLCQDKDLLAGGHMSDLKMGRDFCLWWWIANLNLKRPAEEGPAASKSFLQRDSLPPDRSMERNLPLLPYIYTYTWLIQNLIVMSRICNLQKHIHLGF